MSSNTVADTVEIPIGSTEAPERLLLVANRLPITLSKNDGANEYSSSISSGGLVTGLSGLQKTTKFKWYGWPGKTVPEEDIAEVEKGLAEKYDAIPIWVEPALMDLHYNKYCSKSGLTGHLLTNRADHIYRWNSVASVPLPRQRYEFRGRALGGIP